MLDVGYAVFRQEPFDSVSMDQIAERAGVTRALMYHYFPTKADFFAAIWHRAHDVLRASANWTSPTTVRESLIGTLSAHLDFYADNVALVRIANRSAIASTPAVRKASDDNFTTLCTAVLDAAGAHGRERMLAAAAFAGWISFVRETSLAALADGAISPADNLALCVAALDATVGAHADLGACI